jgi:hypothetical protein
MAILYGVENMRFAYRTAKTRTQTYWLSAATMLTRTSVNVTLGVHCLSYQNGMSHVKYYTELP